MLVIMVQEYSPYHTYHIETSPLTEVTTCTTFHHPSTNHLKVSHNFYFTENNSLHLWTFKRFLIDKIKLFHDRGPYHIETSPLICRAWTGFYMVGTSVIKELNTRDEANNSLGCLLTNISATALSLILVLFGN